MIFDCILRMANGQPAGWVWTASVWLDGSQLCGRSQDCGAQASAAACSQAMAMPQGSQAAADTLTKGRLGKGLAGLDSEGLGCQICGAEVLGCLHPKK